MPERSSLRSVRYGLLCACLTLLYGFGLGGAFGAAEESIKGGLQADADAVMDVVYQGDATKQAEVTSKAWSYLKRAHLHANGIGTTAVALCLLLAWGLPLLDERIKTGASLGLGLGGLGYSCYWLLAGLRAPGLGSTHDAKESLDWLAIPSAGLATLGVVVTLGALVHSAFVAGKNDKPEPEAL